MNQTESFQDNHVPLMTNQKTWGGIMNEGNIQVPKL
jgi:hypothetical protein